MKKKLVTGLAVLAFAATAQAAPYNFNGTWVEVDAWTGSGVNESILVVDWNKLDTGPETLSQSHAFGYRWDGEAYLSDMLSAFNNAGILTVTTTTGGGFIKNIGYDGAADGEVHLHVENYSWLLASTADPNAIWWGTGGYSEWDFNTAGANEELLADGQYEAINAIMWYGTMPDHGDDQLDIPFAVPPAPVPVPGAIWLVGAGLVGIAALRRKR
ncbi:MAG: PEP-CTERM sorting domain-containing protein [Desulfobulbus sp.]